jgi:putative hydrolase of the HAD superfamily
MMTKLPRAILFDLDDTILASGQRPGVLLETARVFAGELAPFTPEQVADHLEAVFAAYWSDPARHREGRLALAETRRRIVGQALADLVGSSLEATLGDRFADRFTESREQMAELFPSARETVETLRARGVLLALITNGAAAAQRAKIDRFDLAGLFHHIQIEGEHGFGKPEDRAYLHAMQALGVTPAETWMVGDHLEWEVAAPQRLGIYAVWCDAFGRGLPADSSIQPDRTIRLLAELLD